MHIVGFVNVIFVRILETVNLRLFPLPLTLSLRTDSNVRNSATILTR